MRNPDPGEPADLFARWLDEAVAAGVTEPRAVTLATVDEHGHPDSRVLILRDVSDDGWRFTTFASSPAGVQLAGQPHAALNAYWREQARQVRARGPVTLAGPAARAADFLAQSDGARVAGLVGRQSAVLADPADLERAQAAAAARLAADPGLVAPDHAVYLLRPTEVEFWQGAPVGRHIRLRYRRAAGDSGDSGDSTGWVRERLWP